MVRWPVYAAAASPAGDAVVTASADNKARGWSLRGWDPAMHSRFPDEERRRVRALFRAAAPPPPPAAIPTPAPAPEQPPRRGAGGGGDRQAAG
eukprot:gene10140-4743_t